MRWTKCENLKDVRSFLGITGVLRAYIPNFGIRSNELRLLLRKNCNFEWGPKQIESMEMVKDGVQMHKQYVLWIMRIKET